MSFCLYGCSVAKNLESANTMFSFLWWIIGFYWITASGETLTRDSPQLYWLALIEYSLSVLIFELFLFNYRFTLLNTNQMGLFFRLCVIFLAFDVVFVMLCVAVACLIGIAVCCCLPCILGILYALTERVIHFENF